MPLLYGVPRSVVRCSVGSIVKGFRRCLALKVGDDATLKKRITKEDVTQFGSLTGDTNPIHTDDLYVRECTKFEHCVVHGAFLNGLVSSVIGTQLPGPGTVVVKQELNFPSPCYVGEEVEVSVRVKDLRKIITVEFSCRSSSGKVVLWGIAKLVHQQLSNK